MQDFRDTPNFKAFEVCRLNRDKFQEVLKQLEEHGSSDIQQVKPFAINAMAFNENCSKLSSSIDLSNSKKSLQSAYLDAKLAYQDRVNSENSFLTAVITNNPSQINSEFYKVIRSAITEKAKFSQFSSISHDQGFYIPGIFTFIFITMLVLAGWGYLKKDKVESPGAIRYTFGIFKGLLSGIKAELVSVKEARKRKKEDV